MSCRRLGRHEAPWPLHDNLHSMSNNNKENYEAPHSMSNNNMENYEVYSGARRSGRGRRDYNHFGQSRQPRSALHIQPPAPLSEDGDERSGDDFCEMLQLGYIR